MKVSIFALIALVSIALFVWKWIKRIKSVSDSLADGRRFGNKVADAVGWEHNLFHSILDAGGLPGPSLPLLGGMEREGTNPMDAAVSLSPYLVQGILSLERRFGPQPQLAQAKPVAMELLQMSNDRAART